MKTLIVSLFLVACVSSQVLLPTFVQPVEEFDDNVPREKRGLIRDLLYSILRGDSPNVGVNVNTRRGTAVNVGVKPDNVGVDVDTKRHPADAAIKPTNVKVNVGSRISNDVNPNSGSDIVAVGVNKDANKNGNVNVDVLRGFVDVGVNRRNDVKATNVKVGDNGGIVNVGVRKPGDVGVNVLNGFVDVGVNKNANGRSSTGVRVGNNGGIVNVGVRKPGDVGVNVLRGLVDVDVSHTGNNPKSRNVLVDVLRGFVNVDVRRDNNGRPTRVKVSLAGMPIVNLGN